MAISIFFTSKLLPSACLLQILAFNLNEEMVLHGVQKKGFLTQIYEDNLQTDRGVDEIKMEF